MRSLRSALAADLIPAPTSPLDAARTLCDVAVLQAAERGSKAALVFEGRRTSYEELHQQSDAIAGGLLANGLPPQTRIAYLGKNSDEYFALLLGVAKAGMALVPVNWRLALPEIIQVLQDAEARLLVVGAEFDAVANHVQETCPALHLRLTLGPAGEPSSLVRWAHQHRSRPLPTAMPDDVVLQVYTSGTTGQPKGVMLTHRNLLGRRPAAGEMIERWRLWEPSDVSLVAMPVFHVGGTGFGLSTLVNGATGVVMREFDPRQVLGYVERDSISKLFLVPSALRIVLQAAQANPIDFSRIRYILYGASPIPLDLLRECIAEFGCGFVQLYGMTETAGTITALSPQDHVPEGSARMRSAGRPLPGVEIAIVDENGSRLEAGAIGEIITRSSSNMAGYWRRPAESREALDDEGWLRTGDAGSIDEDGYLFIHDRVKDMIITGGENVYPAEVEGAFYGHPAVGDVAVIGVPDAKWGEAVVAVVVPKAGAMFDSEELLAWASARIARYKVPKSIVTIDALPRNASGKVLRRQLRERFGAPRK